MSIDAINNTAIASNDSSFIVLLNLEYVSLVYSFSNIIFCYRYCIFLFLLEFLSLILKNLLKQLFIILAFYFYLKKRLSFFDSFFRYR